MVLYLLREFRRAGARARAEKCGALSRAARGRRDGGGGIVAARSLWAMADEAVKKY